MYVITPKFDQTIIIIIIECIVVVCSMGNAETFSSAKWSVFKVKSCMKRNFPDLARHRQLTSLQVDWKL